MRRAFSLISTLFVVVAVVVVLGATGASAKPNAANIAQSAKKAVGEDRYCDAMYLFTLAFSASHEPKYLYNAGEVASAADDRVKALQLFRDLLQRFPSFERRAKVEQRIAELGQAIASEGVGTQCPVGRPVCGNEVVEGNERCDDGNTVSGDGCDSNCLPTGCGNGVVTSGEACDDGNAIDGDKCTSVCTLPGCGNGHVDSGETCDDGNAVSGDGCDSNCTETRCGNGIPTTGEACDDGNAASGDGCDTNCTLTACGNGVTVDGDEICDDGNRTDGDGCDSNCTPTGCGNAIATAPEQCDDGNGRDDDLCTNACTKPGGSPAAVSNVEKSGGASTPWIVASVGAVVALLGTIGGAAAVAPAIQYNADLPQQKELQDDLEAADNDQDRADVAQRAGELHDRLEGDLRWWNDFGQFVAPTSFALGVAGLATGIGGAVWALSSSSPAPAEGGEQ